jgi:type IV pilus assembly protein PilW
MNKKNLSSIWHRCQRGFSLVELMVAMALGLIILGAVGYLYLGSRQTFRTTDAIARIQENARYALQIVAHDVRMAGYVGCANLSAGGTNTIATPLAATPLTSANAINGWDAGAAAAAFGGISRPAGDVISITGAFGSDVNLLVPVSGSASLKINGNPLKITAGDVLLVGDCRRADIFAATGVAAAAGTVTIAHGSANNTTPILAGTYDTTAVVMKLEQYTYFIGTNPSGGRSLFRNSLSEGTVEVADNVWDMQILYAIDANGDGSADSATGYIPAGSVTNWSQVVSARISLLLVSQDNVLSTPQTYTFFGDTSTAPSSFTPGAGAPDRLRMHQVFTTTVGVRNRLAYGA